MLTRPCIVARAAMLGWAALAMTIWAVPTRAGSLFVGPTSEGSRLVQEYSPPGGSETLVGKVFPGSLLNLIEGRVGVLRDSAFEFPIASISTIPQGAVVTSATFSLNIAGAQQVIGSPILGVSGYADVDGVVGLDDFHKPTTSLGNTGVLPNSGPTSLNIPFDFDVTSFIQSLVNNGTPFAGFRLDVETNSDVNVWDSGAPDPTQRPPPCDHLLRRAGAPERVADGPRHRGPAGRGLAPADCSPWPEGETGTQLVSGRRAQGVPGTHT